jgi:hypothetical protein
MGVQQYEMTDGRVAVLVGGHEAVVERIGEVESARHVPIGTRRAAHLRMHLDGEPVQLHPGPGRWARRSYRVRATHRGVRYLLKPISPTESEFVRDGVVLGTFGRDEAGVVEMDLTDGADPADVALGSALAFAFGTGAELFWVLMLQVVGAYPD